MVADAGNNAAAYGPLAPVFLEGRAALRQESLPPGEVHRLSTD